MVIYRWQILANFTLCFKSDFSQAIVFKTDTIDTIL
jgi:hypothetical protein